ncbi:MAG: PhoPQ-activated pathogenicity-like protein PqaA type [Planctomycetes bacterium]|jgi:PhoPQ-activated pathogenicity-related protein|nr:PhoPQ-activated pathogenicity-like protein PqaA type [Planctomycetota bacterium]MDP6409555.1 PhoPQ-activated protein PqaA family protein [Planctomycetota bacterium]
MIRPNRTRAVLLPSVLATFTSIAVCGQEEPGGGLKEMVREADANFGYEVLAEDTVGSCKATVARLTSQTWQEMEWWHWLSILAPSKVEHPDKVILFITGGSNRDEYPQTGSSEAVMLSMLAEQSGATLAVLQQVPNQPLFDGLYEDDLIAYTFDKYLLGEGDDWPLLAPMVESAVRAMDAVQQIASQRWGREISEFIVSGASKRGWTTWLTAAVDERVSAIAPMVIDVLNIQPQMERQQRTYGGFSEQIEPYTKLRIQERMASEDGRVLTSFVDPFTYRSSFTMPKLVLLGTNDPFWTVNASSLYFDELPGPKNLFYLPNAGHGLGLGVLPTVTAFFRASMADEVLPNLNWKTGKDGALTVRWPEGGKAKLWQATSPDRDFRKAKWTASDLKGKRKTRARVDAPGEGWTAWYVEVTFEDEERGKYRLSTEIQVVPDTYPHELPKAESPGG